MPYRIGRLGRIHLSFSVFPNTTVFIWSTKPLLSNIFERPLIPLPFCRMVANQSILSNKPTRPVSTAMISSSGNTSLSQDGIKCRMWSVT